MVGGRKARSPRPVRTFDGREAYFVLPLTVVQEYPFTGSMLEGAKLDAEMAFPDLLVENKGRVAVTIHWRTAPSLAAEVQAFAAGLARRYDLDEPLRGRMAVELRPPVPVDKGTVTAELAAGASVVVFAGDDAGDLVAFDVLTRLAEAGAVAHTVRIGVRSTEAPPGIFDADVLVDGPAALARS